MTEDFLPLRTKGQHLFLALSFDPFGRSRPVPVYYVRPRTRSGTVITHKQVLYIQTPTNNISEQAKEGGDRGGGGSIEKKEG